MAGINRQRREHWKNFFLEITLCPSRALSGQLRDIVQPNAVFHQRRHQFVVPKIVLGGDELMYQSLNGVERFRGRHAVRSDFARLTLNLLFDAGDANLEKFVEIVAEDGHELDPLHQRLRRVLRFFQNAAIKFQPTQFAINKIRRIGKIAFRLNGIGQKSELVGGRYFGSSSLHDALPIQLRSGVIYASFVPEPVPAADAPTERNACSYAPFAAGRATTLGMTMSHTGAVTCW